MGETGSEVKREAVPSLLHLCCDVARRSGLSFHLKDVPLPPDVTERLFNSHEHCGELVHYCWLTITRRKQRSAVWSCCGHPHNARWEELGGPPCSAPLGPVHRGKIKDGALSGKGPRTRLVAPAWTCCWQAPTARGCKAL
ncbi:hypothetical protein CYMTET_31494 [Cymbomonas tetramitiformis]|uniref:Uncharacterized protein n=1 Tax=Cymbomonas tetramitiformis TaxID=36881 RepID=A0AAE0FGP8_9CHLO|nr:hypothetical protein CYMTET_31494 [Cymbomonas tetramitiformis]